MIEWTEDNVKIIKELIAKRLEKYEFQTKSSQLFPKGLSNEHVCEVLDMFLCIGINSSGQTITANNALVFAKKGVNRFFLSLKNRRDLSADMFKNNEFKGKYNIACDFYIGPVAFWADYVPDHVLETWNAWMKPLRIKGRYGVKVVKHVEDGKSADHVKYLWITRYVK